MSKKNRISSDLEEAWLKLNGRWSGDDATAFYNEHIVRTTELTDAFDDACIELEQKSTECLRELQAIEQSLLNQ